LYNAVNFSRNIYTYANITVQSSQLAVLCCPSDSTITEREELPYPVLDIPVGVARPAKSSYGGCTGIWYYESVEPKLVADFNGAFGENRGIPLAEFTDGTSTTLLLGERAHGRLKPDEARDWHWWFDSYFGDTLFWTLYPMNPFSKIKTNEANYSTPNAYIVAAGSMHPDGADFAFADGSVKFIKDTIKTMDYDPADGMPRGIFLGNDGLYHLRPGFSLEVWQAISTRNGGEVISADDY
jgi:prepilin-type processing-associated H-X9-DG protein